MNLSVVVPVFRNEDTIPALLERLRWLDARLDGAIEAVLVVDGSPDRCYELLRASLPTAGFKSKLLRLSRNFGSFPAIAAGLQAASGPLYGVMTADLQEPAELMLSFGSVLRQGRCSVVVGTRSGRSDPWTSRFLASVFWRVYRAFVQPEVPVGGVDVFGCDLEFRDHLLAFRERNSTLIGLIYWLGFPRVEVQYQRAERPSGRSAWTLSRKFRYLLDSAFAFSDLPIRLVSLAGAGGVALSILAGAIVIAARVSGQIQVPGYAATVIAVMFFGGINSMGIGLLGEYVWRAFENTKARPSFVVARTETYLGTRDPAQDGSKSA